MAPPNLARYARRRATRWAVGVAAGAVVTSPVAIVILLLLVVVIILASANQPAAMQAAAATPTGAYACTVAAAPTTPAPATGATDPATSTAAAPTAAAGDYAGTTFTAQQVQVAGTIVAVAKQMAITRRGAQIALAVAMQESTLNPQAVNGPWVGLFQQSPDLYTAYDRRDPAGATRMFLTELQRRVPDYDADPRQDWEIGEVVQESGVGRNVERWQTAATALTAVLYTGAAPATAGTTCLTDINGASTTFDPGNIVSDQVFYNTTAMTPKQIQDFINTQGANCTGTWCLKNLRVSFEQQPADPYCAAVPAGSNITAVEALARFSAACGINPQVMLVTLQKESQLLTRTDPTATSYNAAFGWHCPDTGTGGSANCDPAYAGFFNQGYGMAKQWARYRVDPTKYRYRAGQTTEILWNVEQSGCGGAPVTIANQATASLYNYTPYQPNAASLAAYPGEGDACSSYGNRNFFRMFGSYFGSTGGGRPTAVQISASGARVTIPNVETVTRALAGRTITAPTPALAKGLATGFSVLGMPYVWGGGGGGGPPDNGCSRGGGELNSCGTEIGLDCSGLTAYVLANAGVTGMPSNSGTQRSGGTSISWEQALPGDIVGFPGHVAIYLGTIDGQRYILEASTVGTPIHVVPLTRRDYDGVVHRYWAA